MKKLQYPQSLAREDHFKCPIWYADEPGFVKSLNKASDPYIKQAKLNLEPEIKKRNKKFGNKGDMGQVFHSTTLIGDPAFTGLENYIGATAHNLLIEMGFDLSNFQLFVTELWVQEFASLGGGYHSPHIHWNGHISGFYFLKCSDKTSFPIFHDPRPGRMMNLLPEKNIDKLSQASSSLNFKPKPGSFVFLAIL